jgi:hypothetical protein
LEKCVGSRVHLVGVTISFEKNFYRLPFTPPLSGSPYRSFRHQLVNLLRAATVSAALAVVAALLLMAILVAEAVAVGAPHIGLAEEPMVEAIAEAEATQIATSLAPHATATMLAAELKKFDARSPPRQAKMTASPPSLLDFAICFS